MEATFKSLSASYLRSLDMETQMALVLPFRKFSKMTPATVRPLPTPAPSPTRNPALQCEKTHRNVQVFNVETSTIARLLNKNMDTTTHIDLYIGCISG